MRRLTPSKEQRICQLLTLEMGDRKPSQFLHLRSLAPDAPEDFLSTIWSSQLPPTIQAHLACQPECSLDAAARTAFPRSHTRPCSPTSPQPTTALHSNKKLTFPGRWRHSALSRTTSEPA
jgi:hypothetical protein